MKENNFINCKYKNLSGGIVAIHSGLENIMFKKLFILFKIARKLALSDALKFISKNHKPPFIIKIF